MSLSKIAHLLKKGGLAVIPTDTLYGIVARALDKEVVRRLYRIRRRTPRKPFIILISSVKDLAAFGVRPSATASRFLTTVWPGKVSVILPCRSKKFSYLHLGTETLAFRLPRPQRLRVLLKKAGPLVAPSANPEGKPPAKTIAEARRYFGNKVGVYANIGRLMSKPSTLVSLVSPSVTILRKGSSTAYKKIRRLEREFETA